MKTGAVRSSAAKGEHMRKQYKAGFLTVKLKWGFNLTLPATASYSMLSKVNGAMPRKKPDVRETLNTFL